MFNVGLFELIFVLSFALIFLGPQKLVELIKYVYQFIQKFKLLIHNVQSDLERELKLNELQSTLENEIAKVRDLERVLSEKIYADLSDQSIIYSLMPYSNHIQIRLITVCDLSAPKIVHTPFSYDLINQRLNLLSQTVPNTCA